MIVKQLVVASEYGEPSNHSDIICQRLYSMKKIEGKDICLLLITKNLPKCLRILGTVDTLKIPTQIHCTITGLGGTSIEPHIPTPYLAVGGSEEVIVDYKIDPRTVTIRIDPLIPEFLDLQIEEASRTLEAFAGIGVKDCRISIIDYYPHVRERFTKLGIKVPSGFQAGKLTISDIIARMSKLTKEFEMKLHLCAEPIPLLVDLSSNLDHEGCASSVSWSRLGIDELKPITRKQRPNCTCDLSKIDLLRGLEKGCVGGCAYCYWKRKEE